MKSNNLHSFLIKRHFDRPYLCAVDELVVQKACITGIDMIVNVG